MSENFSEGCALAHLMGVAPKPLGDSSRVARGVVSDPSWVRLKDLVFSSTRYFFEGVVYPVCGDLIQG